MADCSREEDHFASQPQQTSEENKYGGLVPKKKPLISKDHKRAFFDSADWALCKQDPGVNKETLRPKLKRTPYQKLPPRRPACTSGPDNLGSRFVILH